MAKPAPLTSGRIKSLIGSQLRPANNYVGALGHSMLEQGNINAGTAPNIQTVESAGSFPFWLNVLSKGQFIVDRQSWSGAVSGTTSQQMCNGSQVANAIASRASTILCMLETNDRGASTPFALDDGTTATLGSAGTVTIPNVKAMLNALVAAGKFVVLVIDPPRGAATYTAQRLSSAVLTAHMGYRMWCLQQVPKLYPGQVVVLDMWPDMVDNASGIEGDVKAINVRDGLHPAAPGSFFFAKNRVLPALQGIGMPGRAVPVLMKPDTYDAVANPRGAINSTRITGLNSAAGGSSAAQSGVTYSGLRSSGFSPNANSALQAGSVTVTMTRNATSPQTGESDWFEIAFSGTTTTNSSPLLQYAGSLVTADLANLVAGDKITAFCEFQVDGAGTGFAGFSYGLQRTTPTNFDWFDIGNTDQTTNSFDTILAAGPIAGAFDGEGQFINIDKTETLIQQMWQIHLWPSATVSFKVRFRNNAVRKVI